MKQRMDVDVSQYSWNESLLADLKNLGVMAKARKNDTPKMIIVEKKKRGGWRVGGGRPKGSKDKAPRKKGAGRPKGSKDSYSRKKKPAKSIILGPKDIIIGSRIIDVDRVGITYQDGHEEFVTKAMAGELLE